jgi:hypothetical protein
MEILTILTTGALCIVSFIMGAKTVQNVKKDKDMLVYIYASGLLYSAAVRIVNAFRKTAIVYIQ